MALSVGLVRLVQFSSGHRYWRSDLDAEANRRLFGPWASPYTHGHNYRLWVTTRGPVDPDTGMVVNIKDIDDVLKKRIVGTLDQKSINDEVPEFERNAPTVENLLACFAEWLLEPGLLPPQVHLAHLKLEETPELYGEWSPGMNGKVTLTRTYEFAAAHRLHVAAFSDEQNQELFGKCNNPAGHGHNYVLEVTVEGVPDSETGMLVDIGEMDAVVGREIVDRYDHRHFNEDLPEFAHQTPTSELIAVEIFRRLQETVPARLVRVRLHETNRSSFEVTA